MSEGLNLQHVRAAANLGLPWNFMRVEQPIGHVDRIGGHTTVHVVNRSSPGRSRSASYSGISDDFTDFESILGAAGGEGRCVSQQESEGDEERR